MNTKTFLFRLALSFSVVWLVVSGFLVWSRYADEWPQKVDPATIEAPECVNEYISSPDGLRERKRSEAEETACRNAKIKAAEASRDREAWGSVKHLPLNILWLTVLPILLVIVLAGFAGRIREGFARYVRWLRNG
ncbi:hypothetical protein [Sphingomonas sp. dw_22]|uniref:hypothetical protein n=1 Tax=Sphingomonas sp. dw_22 TaxID=2721175 RepID=UPI001BD5C6F0|nr:hypothetical protein [Sphingomonas sp. dw_22]